MDNQHTVSALVRKRAELAGELEALERQASALRQGLTHLDGAIRVFDPDFRPETIRPKQVRQPALFHNGELVRAVLDALRTAGEPLSVAVIAGAVMQAKGLPDDRQTRLLVEKRVDRTCGGRLM